MLRVLTAEQSRTVELRAVGEAGVSLATLMERAGAAVAEEVAARAPVGRVVVLTGPGNNGGDGWVTAQRLYEQGRDVEVFAFATPEMLGGEAREAALRATSAGVRWRIPPATPTPADFGEPAVIVDALLGTGAKLPLREPIGSWCASANASGAMVIAVDVPTGADSDSGVVADDAIHADLTVTFTAPKVGLVTYPAAASAGDLVVADIGIPAALADVEDAPEVWTDDDFSRLLQLPAPDAHKNERGRLLIIGGSGRYPGAAVLAALGAMRSGAGYVTLAVPEPIVPIAQSHVLAVPVVGLPAGRTKAFASTAAKVALDLAADYDAVVLGPGLTLADGAVAMARAVVAALGRPLLIDADALNALVDAPDLLEGRQAPTVMTPHPGELARLLGVPATSIQADRISSSSRLAAPHRAIVLKGAGTVVSNGSRRVILTSGTPALATAGTGDVLAGVIGALLAQGLDPLEAGALGAHLHARAGESAADELTTVCVTAEDVPDYLPHAVAGLLGHPHDEE